MPDTDFIPSVEITILNHFTVATMYSRYNNFMCTRYTSCSAKSNNLTVDLH
jgi:hypothetical protein